MFTNHRWSMYSYLTHNNMMMENMLQITILRTRIGLFRNLPVLGTRHAYNARKPYLLGGLINVYSIQVGRLCIYVNPVNPILLHENRITRFLPHVLSHRFKLPRNHLKNYINFSESCDVMFVRRS